jgi:hypothetical protein
LQVEQVGFDGLGAGSHAVTIERACTLPYALGLWITRRRGQNRRVAYHPAVARRS